MQGAKVSLGGGAGVAAIDMARGVHDLDLRVELEYEPTAADKKEINKKVLEVVKGHLDGSYPGMRQKDVKKGRAKTVKGEYAGVDVSVTLAPMSTEERQLTVVGQPKIGPIPILLVAPERMLVNKTCAFAERKGEEGALVEKLARDALDIVTLVNRLTGGSQEKIEELGNRISANIDYSPKLAKCTPGIPNRWNNLKEAVRASSGSGDNNETDRMTALPLVSEAHVDILKKFFGVLNPDVG